MTPVIFQSLRRCAMTAVMAVTLTLLFGALSAFGDDAQTAYTDAYTDEACIECHRMGSEESELQISIEEFEASAHGEEAGCQACHIEVVDDEHQSVEGSGAADCSECHEQENSHGLNGPDEDRPQCHDCHTRHNMLSKTDPRSAVHEDQLPVTCAGCHPVASGQDDYFSWFPALRIASHNKADFGAAYEKDNCLGCHQGAGTHGESEPINDQSCHRCHLSSASAGAIWGSMHPQADMSTQPAVFAAASIYQVFFVLGLVLLARKFLKRRHRPDARASNSEK